MRVPSKKEIGKYDIGSHEGFTDTETRIIAANAYAGTSAYDELHMLTLLAHSHYGFTVSKFQKMKPRGFRDLQYALPANAVKQWQRHKYFVHTVHTHKALC